MQKLMKLGAGAALIAAGAVAFGLPLPDGHDLDPTTIAVGEATRLPAVVALAPVIDEVVEPAPAVLETFTGSASYYSDRFEGRRTASGVRFRQAEHWAAHRTLPFGTRLRVTNLANGNVVEVEVVDRGPFARGRVLDLSKAAARELDFMRAGHTRVEVEILAGG